ncbi:hypothetical protein M2150_000101 [Lachnospiraceae bacterium PM6-15]|uniref:hypothetical protein n=1 Tax=Ohessyouella blattaphilus TaxID=2949333 RepID=UPI003E2BE340
MKKRGLSLIMAIMLIAGLILPTTTVKSAPESAQYANWQIDNQLQWFDMGSNDGETYTYEVYNESSKTVIESGTFQGSMSTQKVSADLHLTVQYYLNVDGEKVLVYSRQSPEVHTYEVQYFYKDANGGETFLCTEEDGELNYGDRYIHTPSSYIVVGNREYQPVDGQGSIALVYGQKIYKVYYTDYVPEPTYAIANLRDEYNNILKTLKVTIPYGNGGDGSVTLDIPATVDSRSRHYLYDEDANNELAIGKSAPIPYCDENVVFDIFYKVQEEEVQGVYPVTVNYMAYEGNTFVKQIGASGFTGDTTKEGDVVFTGAPLELRVRNNVTGVDEYYTRVGDGKITHKHGEKQRAYEVRYELADAQAGYDWIVKAYDSENNFLKSYTYRVEVDDTKTHTVEPSIKKDGKTYIVGEGVPMELVHQFGGTRVVNVVYQEVGTTLVPSYTLKVRYLSVSDEKILKEEDIEVKAEEGGVDITTDAEFKFEGNEYVRLGGQLDKIRHNYFSKQRTQVVYFRDINDDANADTIVTVTDVINVDDPESTAAAGGATEGDTVTVLSNETTGETEVLDEQGVPLAESIANKNVPKAKKVEKEAAASAQPNWPVIISLLALALALIIGAAFFVAKKKKKVNDVEGNDQN